MGRAEDMVKLEVYIALRRSLLEMEEDFRGGH